MRWKSTHIPAFLLLSFLLASTACSFQVAATKTHGTSGTADKTTKLAVANALTTPPAHHLEWLRALEQKHHDHLQQKSTWGDLGWLTKHHDSDAELHEEALAALSSFNDTTAKDAWADRYASVEALRDTFGRNKNKLWGDLDAVTTRRLYKTLLPRALLELYHCQGVSPTDLAPLAYRARMAAKLYARERSTIPTRLGACLFDGIRAFRKYGSFQTEGLSYDQIWEKYAKQIMEEEDWQDEDDLTTKICYRILEKSCASNPTVDALLLQEDAHDLAEITRKLEKEVFHLIHNDEAAKQWAVQRYKTLKTLLRIKHRLEHVRYNEDHKHHFHHSNHHHHNHHHPQLATSSET